MTFCYFRNSVVLILSIDLVAAIQSCSKGQSVEGDSGLDVSIDASVSRDASLKPDVFAPSCSLDGQFESVDNAFFQDGSFRDVVALDLSFQQYDADFSDSTPIDGDVEASEQLIPIPVQTCLNENLPDEITALFPPGPEFGPNTHIDQGTGYAAHLLLKDSYIYYVREWTVPLSVFAPSYVRVGLLYRVEAKCGGSVENLETGFTETQAIPPNLDIITYPVGYNHIVSGDDYVYMVSNLLYRLDVRDRTHQAMNVVDWCISDVAANDDHVFVYDRCAGRILRGTHGEDRLDVFAELSTHPGVPTEDIGGFVAVGADLLCFSQGDTVWTHALDSTDPSASILQYTGRNEVLGLACDDRAVIVVHDHKTKDCDSTRRTCFKKRFCLVY